MAEATPNSPAVPFDSSQAPKQRKRRYNWNRLLNGKEHTLIAGRDFFTSVRVFQNQVGQMAKRRGIKVTTESDVVEARSKQAPIRKVKVKAERSEIDMATESEPLVFR